MSDTHNGADTLETVPRPMKVKRISRRRPSAGRTLGRPLMLYGGLSISFFRKGLLFTWRWLSCCFHHYGKFWVMPRVFQPFLSSKSINQNNFLPPYRSWHHQFSSFFSCSFFETAHPLAGLELATQSRLASIPLTCLCLLSTNVKDTCHHTWLRLTLSK